MQDIGFLCPGQGAQRVGMGESVLAHAPEMREYFERADDALDYPLTRLCLEGPEDRLTLTEFSQPAILLVGFVTAQVLAREGVRPKIVAGHSLGELTALCLADAFPFEDALRLVRLRGQAMQRAVPEGVGSMAALRTGDPDVVREILAGVEPEAGVVAPANFNGPMQIVVSGHTIAVKRAVELAKARGIGARQLAVSAPFHCELMREAADDFSDALGDQAFADRLALPVVTNVSGEVVSTGASAREFLALQVTHPVRWQDCMARMREAGVERFVEVGPGSVLTGLSGRIAPEVPCHSADGAGGIEELLGQLAA